MIGQLPAGYNILKNKIRKKMKLLGVRVLDNFIAHELSIDTHGMNFLCIFGLHVNGGFISVLNWSVSAEISFNSFDYSCRALSLVLYNSSLSDLIGDQSVCNEVAYDIITAIFKYLGYYVEEVSEPESEAGFYKVILSEVLNEGVSEEFKPGYNYGTFLTYDEALSIVENNIENDLEEYGQSDVYQIIHFDSDGNVLKTDTFDLPF